MLRVADIFAGIGGIRLGFQQAMPVQCVFTSELDAPCRRVYRHYYQDDNHSYDTDITKVDPSTLPDFDVLLAGFPCQSFSTAGKQLGFRDPRGTLFFNLVEIIRVKQPAVIFLENVSGLVHHEGGQTFRTIRRMLSRELGYWIYYQVLNSRDYGSAQNRKRIYIVGFKHPRMFTFPLPTDSSRSIGDILDPTPDPSLYIQQQAWDNHKLRKEKLNQKGKNGFGYRLRSWDQPASTLTKKGDGMTNYIIDSRLTSVPANTEYVRRLSIRECARLQGFPEDFEFISNKTNSYKQLGNSVAVMVIHSIACQIQRYLEDETALINAKSPLLADFMHCMYQNDIFATSNRRSIKWISTVIQQDHVPIPDIPLFLDRLRHHRIVKSIGTTFVIFEPWISRLDYASMMQAIVDIEFEYSGVTQVSPSVPTVDELMIVHTKTQWAYVFQDQSDVNSSKYPLLEGIINGLKNTPIGSYKLYIKSRSLLKILKTEGYGILDLESYSHQMDAFILSVWRTLPIEQLDLYRQMDAELRRHLYAGSEIDLRLIRPSRFSSRPTYQHCLQLLQK